MWEPRSWVCRERSKWVIESATQRSIAASNNDVGHRDEFGPAPSCVCCDDCSDERQQQEDPAGRFCSLSNDRSPPGTCKSSLSPKQACAFPTPGSVFHHGAKGVPDLRLPKAENAPLRVQQMSTKTIGREVDGTCAHEI
jgi:hypothetical protein